MSLQTFTTERLLLRGVTVADADAWERRFVDYEVIRHLSSAVPWPYPQGGVETFLREQVQPRQGVDRWVWGIFLLEAPDDLIGAVDLWRDGKPEHRGFWLAREFWGRGIMTEAVTVITDHAFDALGFEVLVFSNAVGNTASRRIKEKTGARFLHTAPAGFVDPAYTEHELWELRKEDWLRRRAER